jgi:hypothetical protein
MRLAAQGMKGCRSGEPPRSVIKMGSGKPSAKTYPIASDYWELAAAIGRLEKEHPDGARLKMVVDMWMGEGDPEGHSATLEDIGERLARPVSESTASRLLNAAFRYICAAEGGGFVEPSTQVMQAMRA